MSKDLEWISTKLGYWSTAYDYAFFYDAIGQIHEEMKQPEEAESSYREALKYNSHYALARFHLSQLLYNKGRFEESKEEIGKFLDDWKDAEPESKELTQALEIKNSIH